MLLLNISKSKVKGIVRKVGVEFRNGNCGLGGLGGGWVLGKAVSSGDVASHQKSAFVRKM